MDGRIPGVIFVGNVDGAVRRTSGSLGFRERCLSLTLLFDLFFILFFCVWVSLSFFVGTSASASAVRPSVLPHPFVSELRALHSWANLSLLPIENVSGFDCVAIVKNWSALYTSWLPIYNNYNKIFTGELLAIQIRAVCSVTAPWPVRPSFTSIGG